ncbi:MAG: 2-oxoacid:acceptor oxidoreductase family protein [Halanaerobiales bacterium]
MREEIIIAGFGGQGVMSIGKIIAYAAMKEGKEVSWMPSYGPEMRGGTAHCAVKVYSEKIPSPFSSKPNSLIVMNLPSLEKFEPMVKEGGMIILNSSLIDEDVARNDLDIVKVPANEIANNLGNDRIANVVMLGAYLAKKGIIEVETVKKSLASVFPERRHNLIPVNKKAIDEGISIVE